MPGILDRGLRAAAKAVLTKVGKALTIKRVTTGGYNVSTGTATITESSVSVTGFVSQASRSAKEGKIQAGDYLVEIAATDPGLGTFVPSTDDRITIDSTEYQIVDVAETYSGEQICLYTLAARSP